MGEQQHFRRRAGRRGRSVVGQRVVDLRLVSSEDTLAEAGVTSRDAVRRVLLVEDDFGIPVSELTLPNFLSTSTTSRLVSKLLNQA